MTDIADMTRRELEAVPLRKWDEDVGPFDSLVVLPLRTKHDSGYRCMDFVACKRAEDGEMVAFARLSGCSDVVHLDGIGGYGWSWLDSGGVPLTIPVKAWSIDCLPKSGLLRVFARGYLRAGPALGSFELFALMKSEP